MRAEELMELIRRQPFRPLRIHMTGGHIYDLYHPDQIIVRRGRIDVAAESDPKTGVTDRVDYCSLLHVVRVEELATSTSSGGEEGNGKHAAE
jgi:hypothetical protein